MITIITHLCRVAPRPWILRGLSAALLLASASLASAATITVTTTADGFDAAGTAPSITLASLPGPDGQVTLREAVAAANSNPGPDTITFSVNGTFTLTGAANEDNGGAGDLDVKQSLTVQGNGVANTILDGGAIERFFDVFPSAASTFELTNLTLQNGDTRSTSFKEGGAMYLHNNVTSTITDCRIINNFSGANGAIENRGTITITRCVLSGNQTIPSAGNVVGGAMHNAGTLTMVDCSVLNNFVRGEGGGLATTTSAAVTVNIRGTTFSGNSASVTNGGNGNGGAISTTGNQGTIAITNCTFTDNRADNNGGAAYWVTPGGSTGNVTLSNVTISGNTADLDNSGNGAGGGFAINTASVTLHNTIVAKNYNSTTAFRDDISGNVVASSSYNLIGDGTGANLTHGTNNNQVGIDPLLGALQNNGGLTQTLLPALNSPALDQGKALNSTDQRGETRPADFAAVANAPGGDGTDIGSVEVVADVTPPTLTAVAIISSNANTTSRAKLGDTITLSFTASESIQTPTVTLAGVAAAATNVSGNQWTASTTVGAGTAVGAVAFTINFEDLVGNGGTAVTATTNSSSVVVDKSTQAPTLTTPATDDAFANTFTVKFTLPEAALPGSVQLVFKAYPGGAVVSTFILSSAQEVSGERTITFDPAEPDTSSSGAFISGASLADGLYILDLTYRDLAGNTAATANTPRLAIDRVAPGVDTVSISPPWVRTNTQVTLNVLTTEPIVSGTATIGGINATVQSVTPPVARVTVPAQVAEGPLSFSFVISDKAGNQTTVTATTDGSSSTVDRTAPVLTVPSAISAEATSASGRAVTYTTPTAVDSYDPSPVVQQTAGLPSGATFPIGTISVTFRATDGANNTVSKSFTVFVSDTTAPTASVPERILLMPGANGTATVGDLTSSVTASDLVGVHHISQSIATGTVLSLGQYPITFTVVDAAGNSKMVSSTVQVGFARPSNPDADYVAETGSPAPGAGVGALPADTLLGTFGAPALSDIRSLVAKATLTSGKKKLLGIYTVDNQGTDALPAYQGGEVPGEDGLALAGLTFKTFMDPVISPFGKIAFAATVAGAKSTVDQGVWTDAFGPLALALREGSDVPGLPTGAKLKSVTSLSLRDDSLLALVKLTAAKGIVASGKDDVALVALSGINTGAVLLRTGAAWNGSTIKTLATLAPALGSPGQGRWHSDDVVLAKLTLANKEVQLVYVPITGGPVSLLSTLAPAASIHADAMWKSFAVPAMDGVGVEYITSATLVQKLGGVTAKDDVVLVQGTTAGGLNVVAREGGLTPLSADLEQVRYATFFDPLVNDAGQVAFLATLQGKAVKSAEKTVLMAGDLGSEAVVARLGGFAPGVDGSATTAKWSKFVSFALPDGDSSGVVLLAETTGGDTPKKGKLGLWAKDAAGNLRQVARVGLPLETGGPLVTALTLLNSVPGVYGTPRSYSSAGSLAALVTFADKTQALVRFDLP